MLNDEILILVGGYKKKNIPTDDIYVADLVNKKWFRSEIRAPWKTSYVAKIVYPNMDQFVSIVINWMIRDYVGCSEILYAFPMCLIALVALFFSTQTLCLFAAGNSKTVSISLEKIMYSLSAKVIKMEK